MFDKRVVDPDTFKAYRYGYTPSGFNDVDMENAETLLELQIVLFFKVRQHLGIL